MSVIVTLIGGLAWLAVVGGLAWLYVLPSLIALRRRHRHRWIVLIVDVLFGASVVGWLWALVWATRAPRVAAGPGGLDVLADDVRAVLLGRATASPAGGGPASVGATVREIERLGRLRAAGALTDAEFEVLKTRVLRRP